MRKAFYFILAAISTLMSHGSVVQAQARRAADQDFAKQPPRVGDPIPDLTAYDAQGKPFPLSKLKGSYTVLVFGCLT